MSQTDRNGRATSFAYDGSNRVTTITDSQGRTTDVTYVSGKVSEITDPARSDRVLRVQRDDAAP